MNTDDNPHRVPWNELDDGRVYDCDGKLIYSRRSNCELEQEPDHPWQGHLRPRVSTGLQPSSIIGGRVPVLGSHQADA